MTVHIEQIGPCFAGRVTGLDTTGVLDPEQVAAIEAGMDQYAVLVFPGQDLTDEQQLAFTRNFGALEDTRGGNVTKPEQKRLPPGMADVSNLDQDGPAAGARRPPAHVQPRQPALAFGQLVPRDPGEILDPVGPGGVHQRRQYRVRRHAGRVRRTGRGDAARGGRPRLRALAAVFARRAGLRRADVRRSARRSRRSASAWCAPIRLPGASRCICRPMSGRSWAGRCRRRGRSCAT